MAEPTASLQDFESLLEHVETYGAPVGASSVADYLRDPYGADATLTSGQMEAVRYATKLDVPLFTPGRTPGDPYRGAKVDNGDLAVDIVRLPGINPTLLVGARLRWTVERDSAALGSRGQDIRPARIHRRMASVVLRKSPLPMVDIRADIVEALEQLQANQEYDTVRIGEDGYITHIALPKIEEQRPRTLAMLDGLSIGGLAEVISWTAANPDIRQKNTRPDSH